jgi:transcription initiation factor IIE alpha subunit
MTSPTPSIEAIISEFNSRMHLYVQNTNGLGKEHEDWLRTTLTDFTTSIRDSEQQRIREEVERLRKDILPTHAEENGYGCALDDFLATLTAPHTVKGNEQQ